ncbi:lactate utilization protein [Candidatus Pacearchaeota archaeon]|nr:lactate utilization protein [Candidatus Pacearchaeota archaeon]
MDKKQFIKMPDEKELKETVEAIKSRGINVIVVENKKEALDEIKKIIPDGAEIMNGSSTTLNEIGFIDYLKLKEHEWKNVNEEILKENDMVKQTELRRKGVTAEYFLGSVNAIAKTGEIVACDASGSRVTAYPFAAKNLILVAGTQKITSNLDEAMKRVREYVYPLEDERAKKAYGMPSAIGKWVIIEKEMFPNRTTLILVKEKLGF